MQDPGNNWVDISRAMCYTTSVSANSYCRGLQRQIPMQTLKGRKPTFKIGIMSDGLPTHFVNRKPRPLRWLTVNFKRRNYHAI